MAASLTACSQQTDPVLGGGEVAIPVSALRLSPPARFAAFGAPLEVRVEGYQRLFSCGRLDPFALETRSGDTLFLNAAVRLPQAINACPLAGESGDDTSLLAQAPSRPGWLFLVNSGDSATDSVQVVDAVARTLEWRAPFPDSLSPGGDWTPLQAVPESLFVLPGCDSLSGAAYCLDTLEGELRGTAAVYRWEGPCDSLYGAALPARYWTALDSGRLCPGS